MHKRGKVRTGVHALAGGVALLALVSACAPRGVRPASIQSVPVTVPVTPSATGTAPCPASGVRVRAGDGDAAMGERVLDLIVTNCGTKPYTAGTYPTVRVLDADRKPFDVKVSYHPLVGTPVDAPKPRPRVLLPGDGAMLTMEWHDIVTYGTSVSGTYLEVVVDKGDEPQLVEPERKIDLGTTGALTVSPWS